MTIQDLSLQQLLDLNATLSNQGEEVKAATVYRLVQLKRDPNPPPCFGEDDCSTSVLSRCPWRNECGSYPTEVKNG